MGARFGVLAGTLERAKAVHRQLGWERNFDKTFSISKWGYGHRGCQVDVLLIDETALPMSRQTWAEFRPVIAPGGVAYTLRQVGAGDVT